MLVVQTTPQVLTFLFSYEDLYVFFEAVRGFGGMNTVVNGNHFSVIRDFMHLPSSANSYAIQMRTHFERYCAPCEKLLVSTVEETYRQTDFYSPSHKWLQARVDIPDTGGRSNSSIGEDLNEVALEMKEQQDFLNQPEATQAAIRARMKINELEQSELTHCLFSGNESHMVHVDIRNHILRMWYRQVECRLQIYTALMDVPVRFHELGCRVFSFLECVGAINFGAVPITTPVARHRMKIPNRRERVAVVGAGISGLIAARQLHSFGLDVTVLEARSRPGGRICTEKGKFSVGVDMGAMLITGIVQNPLAVLAHQTDSRMHFLDSDCPLFDIDGSWVPQEADVWAEKEYNAILDATARYRKKHESDAKAKNMSLGEAFQKCLVRRVERRKARIAAHRKKVEMDGEVTPENKNKVFTSPNGVQSTSPTRYDFMQEEEKVFDGNGVPSAIKGDKMGSVAFPNTRNLSKSKNSSGYQILRGSLRRASHRVTAQLNAENDDIVASTPKDEKLISRLLRWHIANLEYACAADITKVSLMHWDQDDPYAFQGEHVLLKTGYEPILEGLVKGLEGNIRYEQTVKSVRYSGGWDYALLTTQASNGSTKVYNFDAVLITVPLAVLKDGSLTFDPPLPDVKRQAISRLGTGGLMKVAMEFPRRFWVEKDMFGCLRESVGQRGEFYFFWNLSLCTGKPILVGVVAEPSVSVMEERPDQEIVGEAMKVLRRKYPFCPNPIAAAVTRWSQDPFSRGAYTNIPVGSCGDDYDALAAPVERIFFAGEHTCRMNPTTCASGVISGLREACRILEKLDVIASIANAQFGVLQQKIQSQTVPNDCGETNGSVTESPQKKSRIQLRPITACTSREQRHPCNV